MTGGILKGWLFGMCTAGLVAACACPAPAPPGLGTFCRNIPRPLTPGQAREAAGALLGLPEDHPSRKVLMDYMNLFNASEALCGR